MKKNNNKKGTDTVVEQLYGRLKYMFRFSFTSGIEDIPVGAIDWVQFDCSEQHRVCSIGSISEDEWDRGPRQSHQHKQFLTLADTV